MQINEFISSVNGDPFRSTTKDAKSEHLPSNSGDLFYFSPSSLSLSPSPVSTNGGDDPAATKIGLYLDRLSYQYHYCQMTDSDLMSHLAMQLRPEISLANWKSRLNPKHKNGDNTIDGMAISMELSADMDDLMPLEPYQIVLDVKNDSLRNECCLSYLQEATEQEGSSDLVSRLAMQLRPESSLTSMLPLQPLNENQLLHHAVERQAVPAPKKLASQLNDGISSVIPGPTRVATGAIVILVIFLCISEAHATLSSDPSAQSKSPKSPKSPRQVCSFPSWRDGLNNTAVDLISYIVLLLGYLVNWFIVVRYEVTKRGQSWMYLSCLLLSCIPLVIISFDDEYKHWDKLKLLTGMVASICTIALDVARYANFDHHRAASYFVLGLMSGGAVLFALKMRAAYIAQFADVGTNIVTSAILIICLLWKKDWEYTTLEVFAAVIAAVCLLPNVTTCELPIAVLTGVALIARCLYGVLLWYRLSTTGRSASSWEPAWEDMKTWPSNIICIFYCCKVTICDYFCAQVIPDYWEEKIWPGIKFGWKKLIRGLKYLWSKFCEFVTLICEWMQQEREETQQRREIELTPLRVRMDP